jgi:hypothetical protein
MIQLIPYYKIYEESSIVHLIFHESSIITYDDAITIEREIKAIKPKNQLRLVDIRAEFEIDEKARHYLDSPKTKSKIFALAILVGANTNQTTLDFYHEMNCKKTKTKIFVNYDIAIEWLSLFKP